MGHRHYADIGPDENWRPRSGNIQTSDDAMGIKPGAKRVNNVHRDDVRDHIDACEVLGYLSVEQARLRKQAADKAQSEGDLVHIARDLPTTGELEAIRARKRLDERTQGRFSKVYRWLDRTRLGRAVFHGAVGVLAVCLGIIPGFIIDSLTRGHFYAWGAAVTVVTAIAGLVVLGINIGFCGDWYSSHH